jgi:hypothetical protein
MSAEGAVLCRIGCIECRAFGAPSLILSIPALRGRPTVDFMQIRMLKTKDLQAHFSPKYQPLDGLLRPGLATDGPAGLIADSKALTSQRKPTVSSVGNSQRWTGGPRAILCWPLRGKAKQLRPIEFIRK